MKGTSTVRWNFGLSGRGSASGSPSGTWVRAVAEPDWLRGSVRAARERSACRHARLG